MTKIIYFDFCAIVLLATIIFSTIYRKLTRGRSNIIFLLAAIEIFIGTICSTLSVYLDNLGPGNVIMKHLTHGGYLYFHGLTAWVFLYFILSITDTWRLFLKSVGFHLAVNIQFIVSTVLLIINIWKPIVFYITPEGVYTHGPCFFMLYVVAVWSLVVGVCMLIKYRNLFQKEMLFSISLLYPIFLVAAAFETFYPRIIIEMFASSIALLLCSYNIQRPESQMNYETGFGNRNYYFSQTIKDFNNKIHETHIVVSLTNYREIQDQFDYTVSSKISKQIASKIEKIDRATGLHSDLYYLRDGNFRLVVGEKNQHNANIAANLLNAYFKAPFTIAGNDVNFKATISAIRCPEDAPYFDKLVSMTKKLALPESYTGEVIAASSLSE